MKQPFAALLLTLATASAGAAPVYRCGSGTYSQTPCPGGTIVEASDPRTAAQRTEARRAAAAERRHAHEMERERVATEKAAPKESGVASLGVPKAASAPDEQARPEKRPGKHKKKASAPKDFTAVVPPAPKGR